MEKMNRYSVDYVNHLKKINKITLISILSFLGLVIIFAVVSGFFINDSTVILFSTLYSVFFSISFCTIIYCSYNVIGFNNGTIKHVQKIIYSKPMEIEGNIVSISELISINKHIKAKEIEIISGKDKFKVYCEEQPINFEIEDKNIIYVVKVSNNFVMSIKEKNNESVSS